MTNPVQNMVAASWGEPRYDTRPPFSPNVRWPEYPFFSDSPAGKGVNDAYRCVREALHLLGLDTARWGQATWNPLGEVIQPGQCVVLKPNLVRHFRETQAGLADCVVTHGAVIRAVADYVFIALQGRGRLIVADASQNDADFEEVCRLVGLREIQEFYRQQAGFEIEVLDLRPERADKIDGVIVRNVPLPGDPAGYVKVNLATQSMFAEINHLAHLLYGAEYDMSELFRHHHDEVHEYLLSGTVMRADCVISIPKLKTHKKTGLTGCLKNLVGINGNKNWLPHHREGTPRQGGDQFPSNGLKQELERRAVATFKRVFPYLGGLRSIIAGPVKGLGKRVFGDTNTDTIRSGNWYGNDTTWRMVLDLNRALLYADAEGRVHETPQRRLLNIVDGIIGGQGNGPMDPTPKPVGVVLAGYNSLAVDVVGSRVMGFDWQCLPMLARGFAPHGLPLASFSPEQINVRSNLNGFDGVLETLRSPVPSFEPHFGWKGHTSGSHQTGSSPDTQRIAR